MIYMGTSAPTLGEFWAKSVKNYELLPLTQVKYNVDTFSSMVIAKFCSDSISPSAMIVEENTVQYMMLKESGMPDWDCGPHSVFIKEAVESVEHCMELAGEYSATSFILYKQGRNPVNPMLYCEPVNMTVTKALWTQWQHAHENIACEGGEWTKNPMTDTYAIKPAVEI